MQRLVFARQVISNTKKIKPRVDFKQFSFVQVVDELSNDIHNVVRDAYYLLIFIVLLNETSAIVDAQFKI